MTVQLMDFDGPPTSPLYHHLLRPPVALIGVAAIFEDGILIEAEVTAVLDRMAPAPAPAAEVRR